MRILHHPDEKNSKPVEPGGSKRVIYGKRCQLVLYACEERRTPAVYDWTVKAHSGHSLSSKGSSIGRTS